MDTSANNNDKELRIQELVESSKNWNRKIAKERLWGGIIAILILSLWGYYLTDFPNIGIKIATTAVVVLIAGITTALEVISLNRLSKVVDVHELLALNEKVKKERKILNIILYIAIFVFLGIQHYYDGNESLTSSLVWYVLIPSIILFFIFLINKDSKDISEIQEIKELMEVK